MVDIHYTFKKQTQRWKRLPAKYNIQVSKMAIEEIAAIIGKGNVVSNYRL